MRLTIKAPLRCASAQSSICCRRAIRAPAYPHSRCPATPTHTPQPGGAPRGIEFLSYIPNISMSLMQNFTKQIAAVEDYFLCCFPLPGCDVIWLRCGGWREGEEACCGATGRVCMAAARSGVEDGTNTSTASHTGQQKNEAAMGKEHRKRNNPDRNHDNASIRQNTHRKNNHP